MNHSHPNICEMCGSTNSFSALLSPSSSSFDFSSISQSLVDQKSQLKEVTCIQQPSNELSSMELAVAWICKLCLYENVDYDRCCRQCGSSCI
jgi:hypothetical protein